MTGICRLMRSTSLGGVSIMPPHYNLAAFFLKEVSGCYRAFFSVLAVPRYPA